MIHLRAIEYAPRPKRSDVRLSERIQKDLHDKLRKEMADRLAPEKKFSWMKRFGWVEKR